MESSSFHYFKKNIFFSFLSFQVLDLDMPLSCEENGTICKKVSTEGAMGIDIVGDFLLGSIACLICVIFLIMIMYMLCGKGCFRNRLHGRPRLHPVSNNQEQSTNINRDQQQPPTQVNLRRSSHESSPSYQETNIKTNVSLDKNIESF